MKFTRFFCAAVMATAVVGGLAAGAAPGAGSGAIAAWSPTGCEARPGDTEWTNPAVDCPPVQ
ncbi:hypothetical protein M4914_13925 [Streptomyces somaliensis DSM 40738]|uniref:Secreted protein n=1 Tax=Streptomyces somaliensis (strain ATCC 33201 / DSM 40738 / JCM 12659 / KCTC 9044 / NCTC 11332 / NRRL B-12077 / IP 733) TaxID=1134445 RepID=A0AA44DAD4_STRE0|nr:hypothetical protein [Streptomyces somaliensis]MCQ0023943.1 hypothetical protein [Streptomyces somaliensis DSM 40738]NKY13097.1 hypothetical protein [Streptomyces somaliensis DSM 40738]